jgi:hypothetical protein
MARKANLDFIPQQRMRPVGSSASSIKLITEPARTTAPRLQELYGRNDDVYQHWGLNE